MYTILSGAIAYKAIALCRENDIIKIEKRIVYSIHICMEKNRNGDVIL